MDLVRPGGGHDFTEEAAFITANPDWPQQGTLKVRAEASITTVSDEILRPWFEGHKPVTPLAKLRAADLLVTAGHADEAARAVRNVWINDDFGGSDERSILARYEAIIRPEDHISRLDRLVWEAKADDAQRMFDLVPADWKALAEARIKLNAGVKTPEAALDRVPISLRDDPGLAYERMRWYRKHEMENEAVQILERTNILGRPEIWWPDRQILVRKLLQSDPARAYRVVANHQLKDPSLVTDAEFLAGWLALRFLKEPAKALTHFTRLKSVAKLPLTQARGGYWLGRTYDALGNRDQAVAWYTKASRHFTTYYGQLASAEPGVAPLGKPAPEPRASREEAAAFHAKDLVRAARLFAAIDEPDRVRIFVARLTELARTPADHALVADLAEDLGRADLGVSAAKKASYTGVSLLRAGYPTVPTPRNAGAEQPLLLAFTRQESAFDIRAVSSAGALGLMQLLPGTAADMAKATSLPYNQKRLTTDGAYNVALGQAFVDTLLASFNGSYVLSIAAYNAGPGRVRQWLQQFGDPRSPETDIVDWVEQIPFTETRNYVQRVLENLQIYRLRIGNKDLAFSLETDLRR